MWFEILMLLAMISGPFVSLYFTSKIKKQLKPLGFEEEHIFTNTKLLFDKNKIFYTQLSWGTDEEQNASTAHASKYYRAIYVRAYEYEKAVQALSSIYDVQVDEFVTYIRASKVKIN